MLQELRAEDSSPWEAGSSWSDADCAALANVEQALSDSLQLKHWFEHKEATDGYADSFELLRTFNQPNRALGFFDTAPLSSGPLPVMGVVQESLFDRAKHAPAELVRDEFREFVLRYFLRVSDFRLPSAYAADSRRPEELYLPGISWCSRPEDRRFGFGYSQLYYKRRGSSDIGRFPDADRFAIIDLRELGETYDWIVAKVRIFDFNLTFHPAGPGAFALVLPLTEENYLVLAPDFIVDRDRPRPGVLGEYGFGYALLHGAEGQSLLAYGPGQFRSGYQLMNFCLLDNGATLARLAFVVNRPERILNVPLDPFRLSFGLADLTTLGMASRWLAPLFDMASRFAPRFGSFDPITSYIALANMLTAGLAADRLCISLEQLEKDFLVQHFMQHYQLLTGAMLTWRRVPDWLDAARLPAGVVLGVTS